MKRRTFVNALLLFTVTLFFSNNLLSQTTSAPAANNPALKEAALKANKKKFQEKQNSGESTMAKNTNYVSPIDENDQYLGKEKEYLNMIILPSLPTDFPKYQKGSTFVEYDSQTEIYFKQHKDILKEAYKAKF